MSNATARAHTDRRPNNYLLRALPDEEYGRLLPDLTTIPMRAKRVLQKHGQPVEHVYFPNGGVASITALLSDGTMVETATIGVEGMIGIEALFGNDPVAAGEIMVQVPDTDALMLGVGPFRQEITRYGVFADLIGRYTKTIIAQMMQAAACNARHHVHERCARWLLMTHDRMHRDDFQLSHEFLAIMLGVRRQTITVVAGTLQEAGLIRYAHGNITIVNRKGLEAASCECYALIRSHFDALRL